MMSSSVIELLQNSIDNSTGENQYLKDYLVSCLEHGIFHSKDNGEFVLKTINTSLNSSFDKEKGLIVLLTFLPQIPADVFSNNAVSWMVQSSKIISLRKGDSSDDLSLKVLSKLIKLSVKFPEVNRETAKEIIPKFLLGQVKQRSKSQISIEFLECLQTCMSTYYVPAGDFRTDILRLLLGVVERSFDVVDAAARCIPLVAQVGGAGKMGLSHKTNWRSLHLGLVNLLHILLNKIYQHIDTLTEVRSTSSLDPALTLAPVTETDILFKTQRLAKQFVSVARYLQAMLLQEFPVAKSVAPEAILNLISHAQKPTHSALGSSRESLAVTSVLPSIQRAALHLLESLVLCLGRNLVPHAGLINHLCSQIVVWSHKQYHDWPYAMDKPYSETRFAAYSCLYSWLTVVGAASRAETLVDKALPVMLSDVFAQKPSVRLKVGSKSSKAKKKQQMLVNVEDRSEKLGDNTANSLLCEKALLTLTQFVSSTAPYLKAETLTGIQETVLTVSAELPVPYSVTACRNSLYQLLLTLCLAPHPRVPPPLASAIALFTAGIYHPDPQVKVTCLTALSSLEKIVHPTAATLYFPLPQESQKSLISEKAEDESDSSDFEEAEHPAKKKRLEPDDICTIPKTIILDDSEDNSSVKSLKVEVGEDKIEVNISDDSVGIVEVTLEESRSSVDTVKTSNKNVVDVIVDPEIISESVTASIDVGDSNKTIKEPASKDNTKNAAPAKKEISNAALSKIEDADVSVMMMDFNDEVNNDC